MYDHSSLLIVGCLFALMLAATELGYRLGHRFSEGTVDAARTQINAIQGSLLGVLGLLLGFTFSLSLQRFDSRSEAVIREANAIGAAMLRADLLPEPARTEAERLLNDYLDQRVRASSIALDHEAERDAVLRESEQTLRALWQEAARAAEENPTPVSGLFIQSLNQMIDTYTARDAALKRHVPEPVLFLMFTTFLLTAFLVGYAGGVGGHRASFATYILFTLVTSLVFLIIDLDRPRRGLIEVSQQSLVDLQSNRRGLN